MSDEPAELKMTSYYLKIKKPSILESAIYALRQKKFFPELSLQKLYSDYRKGIFHCSWSYDSELDLTQQKEVE